jgi:hypothetical protein
MATPRDLNLGPLTTTFTAPSACSRITVASEASSYAPYVYPRLFSSLASSCFPSLYPLGTAAFTSIYAPYGYHDEHVFFSPGLCPSGWKENVNAVNNAETTAFCCPPGFNPKTSPAVIGGYEYPSTLCTSSISSTVITTVAYTGDGVADGKERVFTFQGNNVPMGALWIRYRSGDFGGASITGRTAIASSSGSSPGSGSFSKVEIPTLLTSTNRGKTTEIPASTDEGTITKIYTSTTRRTTTVISTSTSGLKETSISTSLDSTSGLNGYQGVSSDADGKANSLSTTAKIEVGLGLALGVVLFVIASLMVFRWRKLKKIDRPVSKNGEQADIGKGSLSGDEAGAGRKKIETSWSNKNDTPQLSAVVIADND